MYLNEGGLRFKDVTQTAGVAGKANWKTGVAMVDINADGWLDIYVSNDFNEQDYLYIHKTPQSKGIYSPEID